MKSLQVFVFVVGLLVFTGYAEVGDVWSLHSDFQNTANPGDFNWKSTT